jgi:hypothetical protein
MRNFSTPFQSNHDIVALRAGYRICDPGVPDDRRHPIGDRSSSIVE